MTQPKPPTKATTSRFWTLADDWLDQQSRLNKDFAAFLDSTLEPSQCIPTKWADALASELEAAISDRQGVWVETLIAGRPYDTPLVEWEHRELDKTQDVAEMLAEMGQARRELGAKR